MSDCVALELAKLLENKVLSKKGLKNDKEEVSKVRGLIKTFKEIGDANKTKTEKVDTKTLPKEVEYESINVYWDGKENKELSNLHPRKFNYNGKEYKSVEHAYQTLKSGSFDNKVYNADWSKGGLVARGKNAKTEGDYNIKLMYELMLKSFESNEKDRDALIATLGKSITHKQNNGIWKDKFPELLEEVREKLAWDFEGISPWDSESIKKVKGKEDYDVEAYKKTTQEGGERNKAINEAYTKEIVEEQRKKKNPEADTAKYNQERFLNYSKAMKEAVNSKKTIVIDKSIPRAVGFVKNILLGKEQTNGTTIGRFVNKKDSNIIKLGDLAGLKKDIGGLNNIAKDTNKSIEFIKAEIDKMQNGIYNPYLVELHEFIHAGTLKFMEDNPNDPKTVYVNNLYKKLLKEAEGDYILNNIQGGYWKNNVGEFIAVALSNIDMINYLSRKKAEANRTVWSKFVDTVANMLGIRNESEFKELLQLFSEINEGKVDTEATSTTYEGILPWETEQEFNDRTGVFQMKGEELKNDAPEIFEAIKNKLKETYPAINVKAVDKIIGTDGLPALGRALKGAIEYVPNEAGLDTLPHEYAHIYIDLLEGTRLVEKVLKEVEKRENLNRKDAKEHLVNIMGKNYVKYLKNEKKIDLKKEGKDNDVSMAQLLWRIVKKYLGIGVSAKEFAYDLDTLSSYFYEGNNADAIRFSPKEGFEKVDTEATFKDNELASEILTYIIDKSNDTAVFTGSAALAMQGNVYRKGANGITDLHDLDIEVRSEDVSSLRKNLEKDYNGVPIYEFPIVKNKELAALVNYLEKRVKKDASTKMILGIGKLFIRSNKISTLIVPPKGLTVANLKRHGGKSYGRVVSYDLVDSTGSIKGSYKAELSEVAGSKRTTVKKEIFDGDKAVVVDLLGNEEKTLDKKVKVFSETLKTYINVKAAEAIFDAKNDIGGFFPRDKDVMDRVFFYKGKDYGIDSNFISEFKRNPKSVIYNEIESGKIETMNLIMSSMDC